VKNDLRRAESQCLDEENGPSPPLRKKQWFLNSLVYAGLRCLIVFRGITPAVFRASRLHCYPVLSPDIM
ncbi:MAG: hypothetical protein E6230_23465, partial [Paenibacillus dendritiformis]|nr:hypothetical protein [Paenibacillus dendritiformis]